MNWEAIAAIGETASFDASHSWAEVNERLTLAPDDVLGLVLRTYDPNATGGTTATASAAAL